MNKIKINEIFQSINGEVTHWTQGSLTTFIRFSGCNLDCSYCDANYHKKVNAELNPIEVLEIIEKTDCKNVTITGGEPTLQPMLWPLLSYLGEEGYKVTIETNGTNPIIPTPFISWVVDYKFNYPNQMNKDNWDRLTCRDWLKFVVKYPEDLFAINTFIKDNPTLSKKNLAIGTTGLVKPYGIVDYLIQKRMYNFIINYQIHKQIWQARGEANQII